MMYILMECECLIHHSKVKTNLFYSKAVPDCWIRKSHHAI